MYNYLVNNLFNVATQNIHIDINIELDYWLRDVKEVVYQPALAAVKTFKLDVLDHRFQESYDSSKYPVPFLQELVEKRTRYDQ